MGAVNVLGQFVGQVRRAVFQNDGMERVPRMSGFGSLVVAQREPALLDLARAGELYVASCGVIANAAGALQTVADVPTTAAGDSLYNASTDPRLCLVILEISAHQASGTPAVNAGLLVSTPGAVTVVPTANATGTVIASASGSGRASSAFFDTGKTFAAAQAWRDVAGNNQSATAGVGGSLAAKLDGGIIVRPGKAVGAVILSAIGTNHKWGINFLFAEVSLDLE